MGLLDAKLVERNEIAIYSLKDSLPCTRLLPNGETCKQETRLAVVVDKGSDFLVFPVCPKHLPSWGAHISQSHQEKEQPHNQSKMKQVKENQGGRKRDATRGKETNK